MAGRLYYDDPYCTRFSARVVERLVWEGKPAVVLDDTAFYPTSGGQPHDTGILSCPGSGAVQVLDVVERESDGAVVHLLSALPECDEVAGRVDWDRRFDLMQQHTGQHILSSAALECCGANTVSFHLTEELATIDLDRAPLSAEELAQIELRANAILFENRPVIARFVSDKELAALPLRKPVSHAGPVRIVEVHGFDCSACGDARPRDRRDRAHQDYPHRAARGRDARRVLLRRPRAEGLCRQERAGHGPGGRVHGGPLGARRCCPPAVRRPAGGAPRAAPLP